MNGLLDGLRALGPGRLIGLALAAVMTVATLVTLSVMSGNEQMALLYGDLDLNESGQIVEHLDKQQIPYQLRAGGRQIFVGADRVARARLLLARESLPSGGGVGYEIFDRGDGISATQFQQRMNQLRALEGELARTIRGINGVRSARVHIVLPKREPFEKQAQLAQASVLLTTGGAGGLDRDSVQAIVHLVATAVPGLKIQNITVADSRGNLLSRSGDASTARSHEYAEELRRGIEARIARSAEEILERSLGPGRVRAEATVELDLDRVSETREMFDPEGQVVRSTQTANNSSKTSESTPSVSVQNNLPNADAGAANTGSQEQRQDETTNFEISKTVRSLVRDQAQIRRISMAVLVDGTEEKAADGTTTYRPRPAEDLERMTRLVKTAIGFDAKRGDQLEMVNMRFAAREEPAVIEPARLFGLPIGKDDLMGIARTAIPAVVVLAMLLFILRPMILRLTAPAAGGEAGGQYALAGEGGGDAEFTAGGARGGTLAGSPGGAALAYVSGDGTPGDEDGEMNLANVEGAVRAASMRRLTSLVERHPEESLSIVRAWLRQEQN